MKVIKGSIRDLIEWGAKEEEMSGFADPPKREERPLYQILRDEITSLRERVKELEEGIEKHRQSLRPDYKQYVGCRADEELYKLIKKGGQ